MSLANYLSMIRIFIGPIFLCAYLEYETFHISLALLPYLLLFFFFISEISDIFDGYLARKYNEVTDLGKILDPMADSIYRISVFLTFTLPPIQLPMFLIFILLYRDLIISTLRTICALKGFTLAARPSGKLKAAIQALSIGLIILLFIPYSHGKLAEESFHLISTLIVSIASIYTLFSGVDYIYANRDYIAKLIDSKKERIPQSAPVKQLIK